MPRNAYTGQRDDLGPLFTPRPPAHRADPPHVQAVANDAKRISGRAARALRACFVLVERGAADFTAGEVARVMLRPDGGVGEKRHVAARALCDLAAGGEVIDTAPRRCRRTGLTLKARRLARA